MKLIRNNVLLSSAIVSAAVLFVAVGFVQAQTFIEPSDEAPKNNVTDFISESGDSQARLGKLRIGSDVIPNQAADPMVDVIGNTYFQGNAYLDRQSTPAWQVILNQAPQHVNAGTTTTNGKLTIQNTAGPALYANSLLNDGIYAKTLSDSTKAVFGQTIQVPGGSISSGVRGEATSASGAGIFAKHANCPGSNIAICGNAAQFVGNVVVTGVIKGDGRGIVRTWTLNDASSTGVARGISLKTVDVSNTLFEAGTPRSYTLADVLPVSTTFISMNVMTGDSPYDVTRATLDINNANYLSVSYNTDTNTLTVRKGSANENLVILFYYHQELSVNIVDGMGNIVDPARALVGSSAPLTFQGSIGNGQFSGGEFLWTLHTGSVPTSANLCTTCGSVGESGPTTTYIPPNTMPASGNSVWLKAAWAADNTIYSVQKIDLYGITLTQAPGYPDGEGGFYPNYVKIGSQTFPFIATVSCPAGECSTTPIVWSVRTSNGSEAINATSGIYTSPATVDSGSSWTSVVRASIASHPELYKEASFALLPQITISATVSGTEIASNGKASLGISQTVVLTATAQGIPAPIQHDFNWSLQVAPAVFGETLTGGSAVNQTSDSQRGITYTAPNSVTIAGRTVTATWRSNGSATASTQTIRLYTGTANNVTFTQTENTTGAKSLTVSGFQLERRIYSFCTTADCTSEQVVNYSALPYTIGGGLTGACGTLQVTAPTTSNTTCNPDTQICTLNTNFSYSATGTGLCTLRARLMGDRRQTMVITLDPVAGGGGCVCNIKTGYCCVPTGETGGTTAF